VDAARERLNESRQNTPRHWDAQLLREELLASLEDLAAAVTSAGMPVPRRLSAEIQLYQRLGRHS
jgi:hypothetical protein